MKGNNKNKKINRLITTKNMNRSPNKPHKFNRIHLIALLACGLGMVWGTWVQAVESLSVTVHGAGNLSVMEQREAEESDPLPELESVALKI